MNNNKKQLKLMKNKLLSKNNNFKSLLRIWKKGNLF